jgi:gliding motility-associated-like protein
LQIFAVVPNATTLTNEYNHKVTYLGTILMLAKGCHTVVLEDTLTGCVDSAQICIDCENIIRDTTCNECPIEVCVDTTNLPGTITDIATCDNNPQVSIDSMNPCIIYTPVAGQVGNDTACVVVCNDKGYCDTTHIIITVLPKRDTIRDIGEVNSTKTLCVAADSGMSADRASVAECSGTVEHVTYTVEDSCVVLTRDSVVGYNIDTLCVVVCDTAMGICDTTVVIISNLPRIDTILESIPVNSIDSICEFVSPEGDLLITDCEDLVAGAGNYVEWSINENGCLVYTSGTVKGTDTLCFKVCITGTDTCYGTNFIITVTGIPPIAVTDSVATIVGTPVVINVLENDTATDSDPLELCNVLTYPEHGDIDVDYSTGQVTYRITDNYNGIDSFQYEICDPDGNDTVWVYVRISADEDCELYNAFSPNGDGVNNTYYIPCIDESKGNVEVSFYNRWGIEVYHTLRYDNNNGWDGRYKGTDLPDGTYYYVIKYINRNNEQINKAGFVVIHR